MNHSTEPCYEYHDECCDIRKMLSRKEALAELKTWRVIWAGGTGKPFEQKFKVKFWECDKAFFISWPEPNEDCSHFIRVSSLEEGKQLINESAQSISEATHDPR